MVKLLRPPNPSWRAVNDSDTSFAELTPTTDQFAGESGYIMKISDTTPVMTINNKTGNIQQLQLSEQQLQQVANFITKLTAKPNGDLQNRHQETKDAQFSMTDSQTVSD